MHIDHKQWHSLPSISWPWWWRPPVNPEWWSAWDTSTSSTSRLVEERRGTGTSMDSGTLHNVQPPLTSRCKSGIWTLEICQPLKRPNFPTSIISHLPSNMYCGGAELFLNPGEDRLEDSYWSQDCVFCISSLNIPHFVFWSAYFLFCPKCVFLWKRSEMIGSHQLENERTINNQRKESQLMFSISLNKAMLPMLKILPRIKQSWYTYWSVTDFTNSSPLFWRDTESQQFFCTEI